MCVKQAFIRLTATVLEVRAFIFRITGCQDKLSFAPVGISFQDFSQPTVKRRTRCQIKVKQDTLLTQRNVLKTSEESQSSPEVEYKNIKEKDT